MIPYYTLSVVSPDSTYGTMLDFYVVGMVVYNAMVA